MCVNLETKPTSSYAYDGIDGVLLARLLLWLHYCGI